MKLKFFIWILVILVLTSFSYAASCTEGVCCDTSINQTLPAQQLNSFYECEKYSGNLTNVTILCNGTSPDIVKTETVILTCNSTQYCDSSLGGCIDQSQTFPGPWGWEYLSGDEFNIFKASIEPLRESGVNELGLYFTWGFLPLLLGIISGIRFKKPIPTGLLVLLSTFMLIGFDILPSSFSMNVIYLTITLVITTAITGAFGNR
jgi:hypothetical protein